MIVYRRREKEPTNIFIYLSLLSFYRVLVHLCALVHLGLQKKGRQRCKIYIIFSLGLGRTLEFKRLLIDKVLLQIYNVLQAYIFIICTKFGAPVVPTPCMHLQYIVPRRPEGDIYIVEGYTQRPKWVYAWYACRGKDDKRWFVESRDTLHMYARVTQLESRDTSQIIHRCAARMQLAGTMHSHRTHRWVGRRASSTGHQGSTHLTGSQLSQTQERRGKDSSALEVEQCMHTKEAEDHHRSIVLY